MIAAWMLYCVAIGLALTVVGAALERGLHLAGRPTRWAWIVALAGSFAIPAAALLRPEAFSTLAVPFPAASAAEPAHVVAPVTSESSQASVVAVTNGFSLRDFDGALRWGWAMSSMVLFCVLGAAALRLAALRRRWRFSWVDGRRVLVSDNVGPAVAGLWRPVVIVPGWALALGQAQRHLMLSHEEEHLRAADPWLLAFGAAALVLMPWNPALWWQVRRLRLAVEIDCDARVLARGGTPPEYGELLLRVGQRRTQFALAAPALGEPVSFLERRIRRMATTLPRWRWAGAAAAAVVAAGAIAGACEAPRPVSPDPETIARLETRMDSVTPGLLARLDSATPALLARLDSATPGLLARLRSASPALLARLDSAMAASRMRVDSAIAERQRPVIRKSLERYFPNLLREQSGPPVDVWLGHDLQGRVSQTAMMTGTSGGITTARISSVFRTFRPGNDAWSVVDRRALKGLVRDNVRVMWVNLRDDSERDLSAFDEHPEILVLPWIRDGITRYYPALLQERSGPRIELWFVADPRKQVFRTMQRPGQDGVGVGIDEIHAAFPALDASNVNGWSVFQGRALGRLVRDNVRVIWVQLREGKSISAR